MDKIVSMMDGDCTDPVSSELLRRLGEAARGFPDGRPRWFVCRMEPVNGELSVSVHDTCEEAEAARNELSDPAGFAVLGPLVTKPSKAETPLVSITLTFGDGKEPITIDAKNHDAIFWGSASVQKFVLPYYAAVVDLAYANAIAEEFREADAFALVHEPDTDYRILKLGNEKP